MNEAIKALDEKFTSGNSIDVERATITRDEYLELRRLHEVNQELLKATKLFQDYMRFMDAQDDIKGMLAFAELVEVNAAAIAKAEGDEK